MDSSQNIFNPFEKYDNGILLYRIIAMILDYFIILMVMFGLHFIIRNFNPDLPAFIALGLFLSYFIVLEGFFGATPGKFLTGLRIITTDAAPPGFWKATIRTFSRFLELNPIFIGCLPAFIIALSNKTKQRMGDIIAHTHVLRVKDVNKIREMIYQAYINENENTEIDSNESSM